MAVAMMQIRVVRMTVNQRLVPMRMSVRLTRRIARVMRMPMVFIMDVGMRVFHRLVTMPMLVVLSKVQIEAEEHQYRCYGESRGDRFAEQQDCEQGADKRRG